MYWRVRKISPEQVAKTYGVHAVCIVSVIFNLVAMAKLAPSGKLSGEQKVDFENFARQVTRHLVDSCFLTFDSSMYHLAGAGTKSELGPVPIKKLTDGGVIPATPDEMKAISRQLKENKSVSSISIDDVKLEEADRGGLVPIVVSGRVVKLSAEGLMGPSPVRFKYLVGVRGGDTPLPVVADFQELPPQASVP